MGDGHTNREASKTTSKIGGKVRISIKKILGIDFGVNPCTN